MGSRGNPKVKHRRMTPRALESMRWLDEGPKHGGNLSKLNEKQEQGKDRDLTLSQRIPTPESHEFMT